MLLHLRSPDAFGLDESEEEPLDITLLFEDLGPGEPSLGWPEDWIGPETQTVLRTIEKGCRAGKSYRPDPSGERRAIKDANYKAGTKFFVQDYIIDGLEDLYWLLVELAPDPTAFLVRGILAPWAGIQRRLKKTGERGYETVRRLVSIHGYRGAFEGVRRQLLMIDLDGIPLPGGLNVVADPAKCVSWAIDELLPSEFHDASFIYQLSSSAGLTKADHELSAHLWFFTHRPYWDEQFRDWAHWWNAKQQRKIIDPALYNPVQPHYVNDPELLDGLTDPLVGRRLQLVERFSQTVPFEMPTPGELGIEVRLRKQRAKGAARPAYKRTLTLAEQNRSNQTDATGDNAGEGDSGGEEYKPGETENDDADEKADDSDTDNWPGQFGAVRTGPGYRGYLRMLGFEGHIRTQIRAAIGSYFYEHGSRADRRLIKDAVCTAIQETPFLDCNETWSRGRREALDYLEGHADSSNVDEMIADIARYQADKERLAYQVCEPSWPLPSLTADEAYEQLQGAVMSVISSALVLRGERLQRIGDPFASILALFEEPARTAVLCEPGVGKTEAVIQSIISLLWLDPGARAVIAVPTHRLGQGLAHRVNKAFGEDIALEWNGIDQPDPEAPGEKMCRRAEAAAELFAVGGKLQLLCSSATSHCPFHPRGAAPETCGYQRQQLQARQNRPVIVVPATMLTSAPPLALQRSNRKILGDIDLLVIDEGPWLSFLAGLDSEPEGAPVAWLDPSWWDQQQARVAVGDRYGFIKTLERLHKFFSNLTTGEIPQDILLQADVSQDDLASTRRMIWRSKQDLRALVKPGAVRPALQRALAQAAETNKRVLAIANVLDKIVRSLGGQLAPSGLELIEYPKPGGQFLRVRWRKDIHPAWSRATVLYLDAAGTGAFNLAQPWFPGLELAVEGRAKAPHARMTQITDTPMGYGKILPSGSSAEDTTADRNAEKLARVIEVFGRDGLVICPKELRDAWAKEARLPSWDLWNFGGVRGRDEARNVRQLVIISRPLPGPPVVELMAEIIFACRVESLPAGEWYRKTPIGRLMADGSGRFCLGYRHPDSQVEAVRFAICEAELLQAVGRGRGVRRDVHTPLDVLLLTDVPLPVPVTKLTTWTDLTDEAGPVEILAARGVLPLDHQGMAAALPNWFTKDAAVQEWFRYRPDASLRLRELRAKAKHGREVEVRDFLGISYKDISIGNSQKLSVFRYRRPEDRQSKLVLVDEAMHADPSAAVEAVLGELEVLERA